jgi:hypothetical protein
MKMMTRGPNAPAHLLSNLKSIQKLFARNIFHFVFHIKQKFDASRDKQEAM